MDFKRIAIILMTLSSLVCFSEPAMSIELLKGSITSHINGQADTFAVAVPEKEQRSGLLLVYLHGGGRDYLEPFSDGLYEQLLNVYPGAVLLSPNYGGASWGTDASLADLDEVIGRVAKDYSTDKIVLVGNSMGAYVALVYAGVGAPQIKQRVIGVVAAQPASDLEKLYKTTSQKALPPWISAAYGGGPDERQEIYRQKSVAQNLNKIPKHCRVVVIAAERDVVVPYVLQKEVVAQVQSIGLQQKTITRNVAHGGHSVNDLLEGIHFVANGSQNKPAERQTAAAGETQ